jgi:hypothetical protein
VSDGLFLVVMDLRFEFSLGTHDFSFK